MSKRDYYEVLSVTRTASDGEIKTSYNYCDMCPWKCGIVVHSVGNRVLPEPDHLFLKR